MNALILGDGLLGSELISQTQWDYISRKKDGFDILNSYAVIKRDLIPCFFESYHGTIWTKKDVRILINTIANTDTYGNNRPLQEKVNIEGTRKLIKFCNAYKIKYVHISTDYLYTFSKEDATEDDVPVHCATWYGYSKLIADALVQLDSKDYLVIRETHKPSPFPHPFVYDIVGNFDYVQVIAKLIIKAIENNLSGVYNIGTELKSLIDLAQQTNPYAILKQQSSESLIPRNTSMDISKFKRDISL